MGTSSTTGEGVTSEYLDALTVMTDQETRPPADGLDALISALLDCGGVLSQIICRMYEFERSGLSSPDAPPILEMAHSLIRDVNAELCGRYSDDTLRVSAEIVDQVVAAICENIYFVPPSEIARATRRSRSAHSHQRRRRDRRRRR